MTRFLLTLEYDGAGFVGWQRQINGLAVQQVMEEAVGKLTGETQIFTAAGRTDSGVHALGMTAHVDIGRAFTPEKFCDALNFHVRPHPISVLKARVIPETVSARFDCNKRHYRYRILNRHGRPALERDRVWHLIRPLDVAAMNAAAQHLLGRHDFESFRSAHCQADSALKTLDHLVVERVGEEVQITCSARSFLHNQVRIFVGTLVEVGRGKWTPDDVKDALAACDRSAAGPTAPAWGLYFLRADYPDFD